MHFRDYANYYNLLYRDKNYTEEAAYVHALIQQFNPGARTLIDLGCGTGNHVFAFESLGYEVTGVDLSDTMIGIASREKEERKAKALFYQGDIRQYRDTRPYDAVVSLFHVMSYQVSNDDLMQAFETARLLLKPGGVFIFDCWYGPGVLADLPASRVKHFENEEMSVDRTSAAAMDVNTNTVEVLFDVVIQNKTRNEINRLKEVHPMRYLFRPEVEFLAKAHNLRVEAQYHWMQTSAPDEKSWYCVFVLKQAH